MYKFIPLIIISHLHTTPGVVDVTGFKQFVFCPREDRIFFQKISFVLTNGLFSWVGGSVHPLCNNFSQSCHCRSVAPNHGQFCQMRSRYFIFLEIQVCKDNIKKHIMLIPNQSTLCTPNFFFIFSILYYYKSVAW